VIFVSPRPSLRSSQTKLTVSAEPVVKCFVITPNSKIGKKNPAKKSFAWRRLAHKFAADSKSTTWSRVSRKFKLLFPTGLASFFRPRELVSFHQRRVTRFPPIGKRIWVGRYHKAFSLIPGGRRTSSNGSLGTRRSSQSSVDRDYLSDDVDGHTKPRRVKTRSAFL